MPFITYLSGLLTAQMLSDDQLISGVGTGCSGVPPAGQNLRFPLGGLLIPSPQASPHAHPLSPPLYFPWKPHTTQPCVRWAERPRNSPES